MKNLVTFNEYGNRDYTWEPVRRPSTEEYMPDEENKNLYLTSVKEAIDDLLKSIYKLGPKDIELIQDIVWNKNLEDWKDVLDDCLANWDTPEQCAQRCINKMKNFFNLT